MMPAREAETGISPFTEQAELLATLAIKSQFWRGMEGLHPNTRKARLFKRL